MIELPEYIGLPMKSSTSKPDKGMDVDVDALSALFMREQMMYMTLTPMRMEKLEKLNNQTFVEDYDDNEQSFFNLYNAIQKRVGLPEIQGKIRDSWKENGIKIFSVLEGSFGENFNNSIGDSFLAGMGNLVSEEIRDFIQMTGSTSIGESIANLSKSFTGLLDNEVVKKVFSGIGVVSENINEFLEKMSTHGGLIGSQGNVQAMMVKGNKIDFPKVWKDSNMSQSYSIRIRLYCPNPVNDEAYIRDIVGPLSVLLVLGLPRSDQQLSFKWPYFIKMEIPGNISLISMINDISVVKGGDSMAFAMNQRPYLVDISISMSSLYSTMLSPLQGYEMDTMMTIDNYISAMLSSKIMDKDGNVTTKKWAGFQDNVRGISPYQVITKKEPTRGSQFPRSP